MSSLHLCNCRIVDLEHQSVAPGDLSIAGGRFVRPGGVAAADDEHIDVGGAYVIPGLVDGHLHIESSMLTPLQFAREAVGHGTTSLFVDPHEIANVLGRDGIELFLDQAAMLPLTMNVGIPSCVPATPMETAGGHISAADIRQYIDDERVYGLAEMMNYPGIIHDIGDTREKVRIALDAGKVVDGHCPGLHGDALAAYIGNGVADGTVRISSEHEATTPEEAIEKWERGMFILLRYGSASKDMLTILPEICRRGLPLDRFGLVSDDLTVGDLRRRGHMNHLVAVAAEIIDDTTECGRRRALLQALAMASLYPARHFRRPVGTLTPGAQADAVILDSLDDLKPRSVIARGRVVVRDGALADPPLPYDYAPYCRPLRIPDNLGGKLAVTAPGTTTSVDVRVIGARHGSLLTDALIATLPVRDGLVHPDPGQDVLKLAVIERHRGTGQVGVGFVKGFGFSHGALASTVAHDSHNLVVVGRDDCAMVRAIELERAMGSGGLTAVFDNNEARLPLPLGGLMSLESAETVLEQYRSLHAVLECIGCRTDPFALLSFLALPVIPKLKLTDRGLVDVEAFETVSLFA